MIKREELAGKTQQEIQVMLENDVQNFVVSIAELSEESDVINAEEDIMQMMNENEAYMKTIIYKLSDGVTYDNQSLLALHGRHGESCNLSSLRIYDNWRF